ncbi:MAG: hypothetical protein HYV09_08215 [Deltaproteobacteria bacterium]|nr:hypothetical protein [Deltaproteobacteria bacterium]
MSSPSRFWVALPGRGKAVEMTAAELEDRRKRGDLPAGTLVARFGSSEWVSSDKIDAVLAAPARSGSEEGEGRTSLEAPPPSSAVQGADVLEEPPSFAPTIAGTMESSIAAPVPAEKAIEPAPEGRREEAKSRTVVLVLATALVALLVSASLFWAWFRYGYARGAVLEHLPADCRRLEYVDFAAIDGSAMMRDLGPRRAKALQDWIEDLDREDGFRLSQDDDAKGRVSVVRTLKRFGLEPYGDVKEMAFCELREGDENEKITVLGGTFRGRDLVTAVREALLRRDRKVKDDRLQIDEVDGRPILRLDESRSLLLATGQIAMIGKRKILSRYLHAKSVARQYGIGDDDVFVRHWAPATDAGVGVAERYSMFKDKLVWVRTGPRSEGDDANAIKDRFAQAANRLRKHDGVEALADAYDNVAVVAEGTELRMTVSFPIKQAHKAMAAIVDSDRRELRQIVEALRAAQGTEAFHHAVLPGVEYFELRLSPW